MNTTHPFGWGDQGATTSYKRRAIRRRFLAVLPAFMWVLALVPQPKSVSASDGQGLVFAWQSATVSQDVAVPGNWASASTLTATVSAAETQDWKASSDTLTVGIQLLGAGGGSIYNHNTGVITLTDGGTFNDYSISVTAAGVGAGWASVATVRNT